ncbi:MAG: DNA primase [Burkholderiaceae bacterium]|jgi:DNA primase|nr:DNA primase [Burkholderiaceae bacterium]
MTIPASFLQDLLARADIVEVVGRYVQLKKSGGNFMGLCPFHAEKSPSFSVSPSKQFYHCFGCGANGDAIDFLKTYAGMDFVEAVQELAGQCGLQVPEDDASPEERARSAQQRQQQTTLTDVLEKAATAYQKRLRGAARAIDYLKGRGLSGQIAKRFGLGYAPEGWHALAGVFPAYDDPLLVESGLVIVSEEDRDKRYDRFRDRVMFPIRNVKGECIGFGGRVLGDEKPKYLNSPETPVFSKGRELYGLYEARAAVREAGYALVTEGYMDVVALAQLGYANAVATLGTACTSEHMHKLFRFTDSVVFSFDGDDAGQRAARKALDVALPYANDARSVKFLFLPPEHDPDSFIREHGKEAFARFVNEATPLSRFLIESAREGCDLNSAEGRAHLSNNAKPLWALLPDGALKRQLLGEIAARVQLDAQELAQLWALSGSGGGGGSSNARPGPSAPPQRERPAPFGRSSAARARARIAPPSRADIAVRLLLTDMSAWEELSAELQTLLCEQPGDSGALFHWLDAQFHEHGAQPWVALREGMHGQPFEEYALRQINACGGTPIFTGVQANNTDRKLRESIREELHDVLDRMLIERLRAQLTEALSTFGSDPGAPDRYRALQARLRELQMRL